VVAASWALFVGAFGGGLFLWWALFVGAFSGGRFAWAISVVGALNGRFYKSSRGMVVEERSETRQRWRMS
jgi:hypothetical protein